MKKGDFKFVLNRDKFIIARVRVYDVTDTHVRIQNVINNDVCPPILPIPLDKVDTTIYGNYQMAKIELGTYIYKNYKNIDRDTIVEMSGSRVLMDIETVQSLIAFVEKYSPENLI